MALIEVECNPYEHKFSAEQQALLREHSVSEVVFGAEGGIEWGKYATLTSEALALFPGVPFKVRRVIDNAGTRALIAYGQRTTVVENTRCHVAVPGLGLLLMSEVRAETDLCTETLQGLLNDGWRILAICVQPDQRRPDYVLGREAQKGLV